MNAIPMGINSIEIGELYPDESGWEKRVSVNRHKQTVEIEMAGQLVVFHPRDLPWLIEALQRVEHEVYGPVD